MILESQQDRISSRKQRNYMQSRKTACIRKHIGSTKIA